MRLPEPFRVALTFDVEHPDRPTREGVIEDILGVLDREAVPATCFLQGRWVQAHPAVARAIAGAGHRIGSHAHHHVPLPMLAAAGLRREITAAHEAIVEATAVDPRPWFRCPFGAGEAAQRTTRALAAQGYAASVRWDVDALDWDTPDASELEERVVRGVLARGDGAVVLAHSWPAPTADALPRIIARLRDQGASFVRIEELSGPSGPPMRS